MILLNEDQRPNLENNPSFLAHEDYIIS